MSSAMTQALLASYGSREYATLNPADKSSIATLSSGNLVFTVANDDAVNGIYHLARATMGKSSGKWYWEQTVRANSSAGTSPYYTTAALVLLDHFLVSPNTSTYPGLSSDSVGGPFHVTDVMTYKGGVASSALGSPTTNASRVLRHKLDMDSGTYEQALDAGAFVLVGSGLSGQYFPAAVYREALPNGGAPGQSSSSTMNFGQSPFVYAVPSGFNPGVYA